MMLAVPIVDSTLASQTCIALKCCVGTNPIKAFDNGAILLNSLGSWKLQEVDIQWLEIWGDHVRRLACQMLEYFFLLINVF